MSVIEILAYIPHSISVRAHDYGPTYTPLGDPISVTTDPTNSNDVTPPTTPTNLTEDHWSDGEIHLHWDQSTDDVDAQANIRYDVYVNDVLSDILFGQSFSIVYGFDGLNTIFINYSLVPFIHDIPQREFYLMEETVPFL